LEEAGYSVARAANALEGLKQIYEAYPDLIIMARELPMVNGEDSCVRVRQASYLPIIVLGGQEEATEILECGADAYMTKPLDVYELVARVRALLRRKRKQEPPKGNPKLQINKLLGKNGGSDGLTPTEYRLASCLVLNTGKLVDYSHLISEVWGGKEVSLDNLHFYMRRLRQKLNGLSRCLIVNCHGIGYRLEAS
jgi:DNA-binding response OmpR family regulator